MSFPITYIEHATEDDHSAIFQGINAYAASRGFNVAAGSYFFAVYDDEKKIVAAISGFDNFGYAEIGGLWVHEALRKQGLGRALVQRAEEWARSKGCNGMTVFTLKDWPVFDWYKTLGFIVEFERAAHANGSTGCYLLKKF